MKRTREEGGSRVRSEGSASVPPSSTGARQRREGDRRRRAQRPGSEVGRDGLLLHVHEEITILRGGQQRGVPAGLVGDGVALDASPHGPGSVCAVLHLFPPPSPTR